MTYYSTPFKYEEDQSISGYWDQEEFEDLVARSLIAMYETKFKPSKRTLPATRITAELLAQVRRFGCYFPANDRIIEVQPNPETGKLNKIQMYDMQNNELPKQAIWTMDAQNDYGAYLVGYYIQKIPSIPRPFIPQFDGKKFRLAALFFENEKVSGTVDYFTVRKDGAIGSCYRIYSGTDAVTGRNYKLKEHARPEGENQSTEDFVSAWAHTVLQVSTDRNHLWNVRANEGKASAVFAVYPEQIKSLFYARELPQTATGRKRPILHWVNSHQRRIKAGTDVDIEKYLRGTHIFEMNGTEFTITNPQKELK